MFLRVCFFSFTRRRRREEKQGVAQQRETDAVVERGGRGVDAKEGKRGEGNREARMDQ